MKLIINTDDCGKSIEVNAAIAKFIEEGTITSTTVMANMDDLEGAARLFRQYKGIVSFGVHLNLTEGSPLIGSDLLIDNGLYRLIEGNKIGFDINPHRNKIMGANVQKELEKELCAQIEKVKDFGIEISHIDSHHHIHTGLVLLPLLPKLVKRYDIRKIRRMRNYFPAASRTNIALRNLWAQLVKFQNRQIIMTNHFGIYEEWYNGGKQILSGDTTLELMCHPGGAYPEEEGKLLETDFTCLENVELINYNEI